MASPRFGFVSILMLLLIGCESPTKDNVTWLTGFEKPAQNPVLEADSSFVFLDPISNQQVRWQLADVFNPAAVVRNDTLYVLFRAEDNPEAILGGRTSRIGLAASTDGINFRKEPEPVLFPDSSEFMMWDYPGGVEDPRVVELEDSLYVMLYTSWNYETARLSAAISPDLRNWTKYGPVFEEAHEGRFLDMWSKSGSVITELRNGRLLAVKILGRYWMYWGEAFVNLAWSENMVDWIPLLEENGELMKVLETRPGKFDSNLTEPGPPALLTDAGIILMYNGKNAEDDSRDMSLAAGTYCGGQALFDPGNPAALLDRMDQPFICPDLPHEVTGQYKAGTTFIEGLVFYKGRWFLYYGTADSMVGLAISADQIDS